MKVFKFGGASIKSAQAVNNMINIISHYHDDQLVVVVSAMGKTTNALEAIYNLALNHQPYEEKLQLLKEYHIEIASKLGNSSNNQIFNTVSKLFFELKNDLTRIIEFSSNEAFYDTIVAYGERLSSSIIHAALSLHNIQANWLNAKELIITNERFKEAQVNWEETIYRIKKEVKPILEKQFVITQGFIGGTANGSYTTLGREGSDFTAAIFAAALNAESVTIWKDVPGILNADPKVINDAIKFENLNYHEAAEMTYYGASVIHPKTIKPLANLNIPLLVKSFENPMSPGTAINGKPTHKSVPSTIFKSNQSLITFKVRDFTFINENNLSIIFHLLDQFNIKINMMQNSAISLSICVDNHIQKVSELILNLRNDFEIQHQSGLNLITVKNYDNDTVNNTVIGKEILLEQKTKHTFQIVVADQNWKYVI